VDTGQPEARGRFAFAATAAFLCLFASPCLRAQEAVSASGVIHISDAPDSILGELDRGELDYGGVMPASLLQPPSPLAPPVRAAPEVPLPSPATEFARGLLGGGAGTAELTPGQLALLQRETATTISGEEARGRVSADAGSLLFKSPAAISSGVQRRNPIINDPRVRGSRVGSLAANGSYWIPARIDLDTMLSKIDSRIVQQMTVIPGPYEVLNGPALQSIQFDLLPTPRYYDGAELHGSTSADYLVNGEQLYGRQDIWGGGDSGGFRFGYGHRIGNDYTTGAGIGIPSSYNSRDINFSLGRDLSPDSRIEFSYLRLDQTNVELAGQAFDIDYLSTDAYEVDYVLENQTYYDRLTANAWYNRTRLNGSAQRPGKRRQFPILDIISFTGRTDVDATSTGYQAFASWLADDEEQLLLGTDLRFINQELNELTSAGGFFPFFAGWSDANSPIPDSNWVNPGLFAKYISPMRDGWQTTIGARADIVSTDIVDDPAKLADVGTLHVSFADIVGTDIEDRTFGLGAAYVSSRLHVDDGWSITLSAGHAQRAPSLTELYVAESFMFLLQNGLNTVTGDPRLATEKLWQLDLAVAHQGERFNFQARAFQAWINDYITFENIGIKQAPPFGQVEQVNLKYVNTDLATLAGFEALADYRWTDMLTPFANLQYVRGQDETRSGDFATFPGNSQTPSTRVFDQPRGFFSGVSGTRKEPLPQIIPLQSRMGLRIHEWGMNPRWAVEISARLVGPQNRVAASLLEQPTPGFGVGDIRAYWRPSDAWTLTGGVENFTNRNYQEHLDFRPQPNGFGLPVLQPGISGYLGVQRTY
jgi:iron complex outermembrane recepter protein